MKLSVRPESPIEAVALLLGVAPVTLVDTHMSFLRARAIMVATRLGVFDAVGDSWLSADTVAQRCGLVPAAAPKLLNALVGSGYLRFRQGKYALSAVSRKWLRADSPHSVRDKVLFEFFEWSSVEGLEAFVRTGLAQDLHHGGDEERWDAYQKAMRALSGLAAPEIVRRTPLPGGATRMLDIGGSHGFISVAMCRRHPALSAVVMDLPSAVRHAAPLLAKENMGERVVHRAGDALTDDLGDAAWDFVYVSQLLHHFDEPTNRTFMARIARALKPGGHVVIVELIRPAAPGGSGQVGALLDLYFALTSRSGTWSVEEITGWQRAAGLTVKRPIRLRTVPGAVEVVAVKGD
ncbi:MAG TPA: class I SAM-dependent methyltransferase [Vicinamibacterales bacterium]|nr:class I SAM-dependent methyltransferase [Vicinamibacterales bacterium]